MARDSQLAGKALIVTSARWMTVARLPGILGPAGYEVDVLGPPGNPAGRSRWTRRAIPVAWEPEPFFAAVIDELSGAEESGAPYDWVHWGDDPVLGALQSRIDDPVLAPFLPFDVDAAPGQFLATKLGFARLLEGLNLRAPAWREAASFEEAQAAAIEIGFPVIVKPDDGWAGFGLIAAADASEMESSASAFSEGRRYIVQRRIEGRTGLIEALCDRGRAVAHIVSLKHRTHPGRFGPSTVRRFIDHPEAATLLESIVRATGFHGFCGIDFVIEDGTDQLFPVEFNGRATSGLVYGSVVGVDFRRAVRELARGKRMDLEQRLPRPAARTVPVWPSELCRIISTDDYRALPGAIFNRLSWIGFPWSDPPLWRVMAGQFYSAWLSRGRKN